MNIKKIKLNSTTYDVHDARINTIGDGLSNISGTLDVSASGVTAGSYGPTANVTGDDGNTIKVPEITVNSYGQVTGVTERVYTSKNTTYSLGDAAYKGVATSIGVTGSNAYLATEKAVRDAINALPEPMIFKGSLGTGGTITSLPTASSSNTGFTYKVITDGTYASQSAKIGDTFISDGSSWILIPSGDEPSGTVTSVGITQGSGISVSGGPITTSGSITVSHADTSSLSSSSNSGRTYIQSITLDDYGHVTGLATATETITDTWRPLGTGASDACAGNDSRLSDARPASDVYSWAKASSKPSYSWSEIVNHPTALSEFTNDVGYITSSGSCSYANNSDTVDGYHASDFIKTEASEQTIVSTISSMAMGAVNIYRNTSGGWSTIGYSGYNNGQELWGYLGFIGKDNPTYIDSGLNTYALIHSGNIGSQSVNYATSAGNADTVDNLHASDFMRHYDDSSLDANNASLGWHDVAHVITNGANLNHSTLIHVSNVGTPFQLQIPDADVMYIYKRCYSSGSWSDWYKMSAGYADNAGNANYATSAGSAGTVSNGATISSDNTVDNGLWMNNGVRNMMVGTGFSGNTGLYVDGIGWVVGVNSSGSIFLNGTANYATSADSAQTANSAQTARYADSAGSVAWNDVLNKPTIPTGSNVLMVGRARIKTNTYTLSANGHIWFILNIFDNNIYNKWSEYQISLNVYVCSANYSNQYNYPYSGLYTCTFNPHSSSHVGARNVIKIGGNQGTQIKIGCYKSASRGGVGSEGGANGCFIPFCITNSSSYAYDAVIEATITGLDSDVSNVTYSGEISDYNWTDEEDVPVYYDYS